MAKRPVRPALPEFERLEDLQLLSALPLPHMLAGHPYAHIQARSNAATVKLVGSLQGTATLVAQGVGRPWPVVVHERALIVPVETFSVQGALVLNQGSANPTIATGLLGLGFVQPTTAASSGFSARNGAISLHFASADLYASLSLTTTAGHTPTSITHLATYVITGGTGRFSHAVGQGHIQIKIWLAGGAPLNSTGVSPQRSLSMQWS